MRKRAHYPVSKRRLAASREAISQEDEVAPRKRKAVVDARAELVRPAPEDTLQPVPVPAMKVVDAAPSVPAMGATASVPAGAAALVPPPPVLARPDQPPSGRSDVPLDNVETLLLAATPASSEAVAASVAPASAVGGPITGEDEPWWTSRWIGPLLMALGLMSLLVATRPLQAVALVTRRVRAPEPDDRPGPSFDATSQARQQHRRHAPAMQRGARQFVEHQGMSRPSSPDPDMSFHEAIRMLTDVDAVSVEARPRAVAERSRAYVSRRS